MSIVTGDIKSYLNPTGNSDPNLSLGGVDIGSEISVTPLHNLFDRISAAEAVAGDVEYRSLTVKNTNVADILYDAVAYLTETSSTDTTIAIAYDSTGTQSVVNESTAPSSPALSFSTPLSAATGIVLGDIGPGETRRIWVRWTVTGGAAKDTDLTSLTISGGTA